MSTRITLDGFIESHYRDKLEARHSRLGETLAYIEQFGFGDRALAEMTQADVERWRLRRQREGIAVWGK